MNDSSQRRWANGCCDTLALLHWAQPDNRFPAWPPGSRLTLIFGMGRRT